MHESNTGRTAMRIAVVNETSAGDKNKDILAALEGCGHEVINAGMKDRAVQPELTYIHTGFMAAALIHLDKADLVIGGCGTGIGFLNSVAQYPGIIVGLLSSPLDAWLFGQINAGNVISLPLNQGYGWAGDTNLRFLFEKLFSVTPGCGYPPHRADSQAQSRETLRHISGKAHVPFAKIVKTLDDRVIQPALSYPGFLDILDIQTIKDEALKKALLARAR